MQMTRWACIAGGLVLGVAASAAAQEAPEERLFSHTWTTTADFNEGLLDNVNAEAIPDQLVLNLIRAQAPFIWVANTGDNQVEKLSTVTGESLGRFPAHGTSPSRTAVASDGSLWLANRGFDDAENPELSNVVHLDIDGNFLCRADVLGIARAITIDLEGNVWAGSWEKQELVKIAGDRESNCRILARIALPGQPYGAAVDSRGFVWVVNRGGGSVTSIDVTRNRVVTTFHIENPDLYGMAIDHDDNVWIGNFGRHEVLKLNTSTGQVQRFQDPNARRPRGVTVDFDGNIWVANFDNNTISQFAPDGTLLRNVDAGGGGPLGMSIDTQGNVWAVNFGSSDTTKFDPATGQALGTYRTGTEPYTYSDMTGQQRRVAVATEGSWRARYDSFNDDTRWRAVRWNGEMPAGTLIEARVRSGRDEDALTQASFSDWLPEGAALDEAGVRPGRMVEIELRLATDTFVGPVVFDVTIQSDCFPELCDGLDNDCNGLVDDGPAPDLCAEEGAACICGSCATPCFRGECVGGLSCAGGFCIEEHCCGVDCGPDATCRSTMAGHICETGCEVIECGEGQTCRLGACIAADCHAAPCASTERCRASGTCEADPCASVSCDAGRFCRDGECVAGCLGVRCDAGESCRDGRCVDDPCGDVSCNHGRACLIDDFGEGACAPSPCAGISCSTGELCLVVQGQPSCVEDRCRFTDCPEGTACRLMACLAEDAPAGCVEVQCSDPGVLEPDEGTGANGGNNGRGNRGGGNGGGDGDGGSSSSGCGGCAQGGEPAVALWALGLLLLRRRRQLSFRRRIRRD